jgi:hypothetical protein
MKQNKYRQWLRTQFVPVVREMNGDKPLTSGWLRTELEICKERLTVQNMLREYHEACGENGRCSWGFAQWTDRVRRALEACVREGYMGKNQLRSFQRSGWSSHTPKKTVRVYEYYLL